MEKQIEAIGVNRTASKDIPEIIKTIKGETDRPIIIYPRADDVIKDPDMFAELTVQWRELGASIIGGCCHIGPEHIAKIKEVHSDTIKFW